MQLFDGLDMVDAQGPIDPSIFSCIGRSDILTDENHHLKSAAATPDIPSVNPLTMADISDSINPFRMAWATTFPDDAFEIQPYIALPGINSSAHLESSDSDSTIVSVVLSDSVNTLPVAQPETSMEDTPPSQSSTSSTSSTASPDVSRPYKCLHPECPLWFKRVYTRRVPMNTHLPGKDAKFACTFDGCSMLFSRKHDRLRHEVGNRGMGTQWSCPPCQKYFSSETTLERHYLDKHGSDWNMSEL
ncbi:hypothetical protein C8R43DRAFT_121189 [Mycena crocata]|nr:hypothetical protein C8R43DRAFT_121189 [Mycena crocata]